MILTVTPLYPVIYVFYLPTLIAIGVIASIGYKPFFIVKKIVTYAGVKQDKVIG